MEPDNTMVPADEANTIKVPLNRRALVPVAHDRVRRLRRHLVESLRAERELKRPERYAKPAASDPDGFAGQVVRAACTLCRGWCCKGGGEHAYLDERTMVRVRRARPELDARGVLRLYTAAVPGEAFADSCIFQAAEGCTLDRSLRADLCNSFLCTPLGKFVKAGSAAPVTIVAGEGDRQQMVSPVPSAI